VWWGRNERTRKDERMKIEIDLKDILFDEDYGPETMQDSIKRQVVSNIEKTLVSGISKKIDLEISKAIDEQIKKSLDEIRPSLITEILDTEYVSVDRYGDRNRTPTTFRKQLIAAVNESMVYKRSIYSSEENAFTKAVNAVLAEQANQFRKHFDEIITNEYVKETKAYAVKVLKEKLGL
jgi:hypothetical protein